MTEQKKHAHMKAGARKCVHLSQIRKLKETQDYSLANQLLTEGWQLLEIFQATGRVVYILGTPIA